MLTVVSAEERGRVDGTSGGSLLDEIVRDGARRMLAAALEAEVAAYIDAHADCRDVNPAAVHRDDLGFTVGECTHRLTGLTLDSFG